MALALYYREEIMDREFASSFMEYQKNGNFWCDMYPLSKLIICMAVGLSTIVVMNWKYGLTLCVLYIVFAAFTGKFKEFWGVYRPLALVILCSSILIRQLAGSELDVTPMFSVAGWVWYQESFYTALTVTSYLAGFSGALLIYFNTTEMRDLMYCLEKLGVTHVASYIMLATMQSIVDLRKSANTILESQKSRGIEVEGKLMVRIKAFIPALGPVVLDALSGIEEKSIAMDARAFSVQRQHTFLREVKPPSLKEKLVVGVSVLYLVAVIVWRFLRFF